MDGIIIIDKPKGYTSHDIVNVARKALNTRKIGHTGTLDPNATGVLPILVGTATKLSKYLIEHDKTYVATLKLGEQRDTGDSEGKVLKEDLEIDDKLNQLTQEKVKNILKEFVGVQKQAPPMYSSIKINGKKAYEYARAGQKIDLEPRDIEIYDVSLNNFQKDEIEFEVKCSKGTYIRVLCEDIAKKLGTVGYMSELRRTSVNEYTLDNAITIEELKENSNLVEERVISIEKVFENKQKIELNSRKKELFLNGVQLTFELPSDIYRIYSNNTFIGLGVINNNLLKRDIII